MTRLQPYTLGGYVYLLMYKINEKPKNVYKKQKGKQSIIHGSMRTAAHIIIHPAAAVKKKKKKNSDERRRLTNKGSKTHVYT